MVVAEPAQEPEPPGAGRALGKAGAIMRVAAGVVAVIAAATLTLGAVVVVVTVTTAAVSVPNLFLRVLAVIADVIGGTLLLITCIYLTTRMAVYLVGVGKTEFPPLPDQPQDDAPKN